MDCVIIQWNCDIKVSRNVLNVQQWFTGKLICVSHSWGWEMVNFFFLFIFQLAFEYYYAYAASCWVKFLHFTMKFNDHECWVTNTVTSKCAVWVRKSWTKYFNNSEVNDLISVLCFSHFVTLYISDWIKDSNFTK